MIEIYEWLFIIIIAYIVFRNFRGVEINHYYQINIDPIKFEKLKTEYKIVVWENLLILLEKLKKIKSKKE